MDKLLEQIKKYSTKFKKPKLNTELKYINTNSWFKMKEKKKKLFDPNDINIRPDKIVNDGYYTKRIKLHLFDWQENIINRWMNAYIHMFNHTIKYFKQCKFHNIKPELSIAKLKKLLEDRKNEVYNWSKIEINKKTIRVDRHLLDYAINDSLNRYKSCLTNIKNKNIKHFRLRYLNLDKSNKIIKIEKLAFNKDGFYTRTLKKINCCIDNFNYKQNVITTSILQYNKYKNEYYLLIKYRKRLRKNRSKNIISLDPGIRVPFTGYSNNKMVEIGTNINKHIRTKLLKIDDISNNESLSKGKIDRLKIKYYNRINNRINDFHWKTIKYLLDKNKTVLIGDLSTKRTGEKKGDKMTKRIGNLLNIYKFKEKLKYKCNYRNKNYIEVNEAYTSKTCCQCGNIKKDLKGNKIYKCIECNLKIDRDINGAINILIKSIE